MLIRVLVVDSEKTVADVGAMLLGARGFLSRAAYNAEDAISLAKDMQPHAVVSDVVLPGMDGVALAAWFAENIPTCKVVLISFNPAVRARVEEAKQNGLIHAFIAKREYLSELVPFLSALKPIS